MVGGVCRGAQVLWSKCASPEAKQKQLRVNKLKILNSCTHESGKRETGTARQRQRQGQSGIGTASFQSHRMFDEQRRYIRSYIP